MISFFGWGKREDDYDWGNEPLDVCPCGQLLMVECREHCIQIYAAQLDRYSIDFEDDESNSDESFLASDQRMGSLEEFDLDDIHVAVHFDPEHGDPYEDFPTLDLPDPGRVEVIDTYIHPEDRFVYMEVRRWPDGQERHLLRSYK